jgi:hypothetical protein
MMAIDLGVTAQKFDWECDPIQATSIPDTPRAMMRYDFYFVFLFLLRQIIEEKVDQYGVDFCVWFELDDLAAE